MTTKAIRALFWKEYRQQALLLVAIFFIGVLLQMSIYTTSLFSNQTPAFWTVAVGVVALYAAGASAILFVREHEEKTFGFLRSLPITSDSIFVGKLAWLLGSTLILGMVLAAETLLWVAAAGTNDNGSVVFGVMGVAVVEALCWGVFWSTRTRSQLNALLATFVCASFGAYLMANLGNISRSGSGANDISDAYANAFLLRLGLAALVGIFAVVSARKWLYSQIASPIDHHTLLTQEQQAAELQAMLKPPKRGEMRWLIWLAYRQSRPMFAFLGLLFVVMVGVLLFFYDYDFVAHSQTSGAYFNLALLMVFGTVSGLIFCSSTFHKDQQNNAAAMLTNYGISPVKVWYSRILVFGISYAIFALPLLVMYALLLKGDDFYRGILCNEPNWYHTSISSSLFVAVTLFASIFCIGQMLSLFFRSLIASIVNTGGVFMFGVYFWCMAVKYLFGYSGITWAIWPMLIACLVASRLRAANWQRGRNNWLGWRAPLLSLAIPALCIMVAYPFVRVYSVPVINLGYYAMSDGEYSLYAQGWRRIDLTENANTLHAELNQLQKKPTVGSLKHFWEDYKKSTEFPQFATRDYSHFRRDFYWRIEAVANAENATKESLLELIMFLQSMAENRVSCKNCVTRAYEIEYRDARNGIASVPDKDGSVQFGKTPFWYRWLMPWEKYRVMRRLNYEFQLQAKAAEVTDEMITFDLNNIPFLQSNVNEPWEDRCERNRELLQSDSQFLSATRRYDYYGISEQYNNAFWNESQRRAMIIIAALHLWYLEHGELPEKLEQLEGVYLDKLPNAPLSKTSFAYWRDKPDPKRNTYVSDSESKEKEFVPYIVDIDHHEYWLTFMSKRKSTM